MDLKKNQQATLEAIKSGLSNIQDLIEKTGYAERTIKSALKKLKQLKLVDETLHAIVADQLPSCEQLIEEETHDVGLPNLRTMTHLGAKVGYKFTFHTELFTIQEILKQKKIGQFVYFKIIATTAFEASAVTLTFCRS